MTVRSLPFLVLGSLAAAVLPPAAGTTQPGRIAFSAGLAQEDVYVVSADGSGLARLTRADAREFDPAWSPDGRRIAYRHENEDRPETSEIYAMNADGSHKRNLTRRAGPDFAPAWSPDGRRIAFASVRGGVHPAIWVMDADGSHQRRLSRVDGEYPTWSPDGRRIVFDRNTFGPTGWDLWIMNADGSRARPFVATATDEQGAAWSAGGRLIAYGSSRGAAVGSKRVWIARADGGGRRLLTRRLGDRPSWSKRDPRRLVFTGGGIFVVGSDGSGLRRVPAAGPGEAVLADWGR